MRSRLEPKPSESSGDHPREGRLRREGGSRPNLPRHYGKRATGLYAEAPSEVGAVAPPTPFGCIGAPNCWSSGGADFPIGEDPKHAVVWPH